MITHEYEPRGACLAVFGIRGGEVLLSGPAGTGKSRACLEKLHALMLKNPGARALIVRKTAESLSTTALQTWRKLVVKEALETGLVTFYGGSKEEAAQYRYTNGSAVLIGGMNKSTRIMSSEYDVIYVQEAIELTPDDWEALTTRLRNGVISFQQLLADTNPATPTHWLKQRCNDGATLLLESRHSDNPRYVNADGTPTVEGAAYLARLDTLTGVRKLRLRDGKWVAAEGLIYEQFDPAVHLLSADYPIGPDWARYWAVDFGYRNPFVLQWWAEDPDGNLHLYREIYHTGRLVEDHARHALSIVHGGTCDHSAKDPHAACTWQEPRPRAIVCDHDAEGRATLEKYLAMATVPADKRVTEGVQMVQGRYVKGSIRILDGAVVERDPALDEAKRPLCTAEEIPGYVWDVTGGRKIREQPVKEDDHGMDAKRYLVVHRETRGVTRVRFG